MATDNEKIVLEFRNITKQYPGTLALSNVSIQLREGEVHAIVGENGAGKSTLIKTCSGVVRPSSGKIIVNGKEYNGLSPLESKENGISVIYQELNLVGHLDVTENVYLGDMILKKNMIPDFKQMRKKTKEIIDMFQVDIPVDEQVKNLSIGKQQMVEIVKAISKGTRILIMDEPTAPLTDSEVKILINIVQKLRKQGVAIIYISHRLEEIFELADRISVLRDGKHIATMDVKDTNQEELIKLMVGRELKETYPRREKKQQEEVVLSLKNLTGNGDENISFDIHKGEVVGIAGLMGAGRTELAQMLFGYKKMRSGKLLYRGKELKLKSPYDAVCQGIVYAPEDRKAQGLILDFSIKDNLSMATLKKLSKFLFVNRKEELQLTEELKENVGIKAPNINTIVGSLSGGNQQKVVLSKWLAVKPDVFILDEPTRGIDVGAKYEIYLMINELVASGMAVIIISSEMNELIGMSDKIVVISEGKMTAELQNENLDQETILYYASI